MLTMQDALLRLIAYWTDRGCLLMQPFNTEVGAGTLNPATFLRVLGPEPWRTVYVEPSVRPDDARYGENPNRMQTHTQLQVILKPEPGDPQELYLGSLEAIGVDVRAHDVRFVEDNWESPALGAWGLGWEVWLDGLEITQFTYFQQAGGMQLDPVSVELTYGMERILMALQGVRHFKDIAYAPGVSFGEVVGQAEYEMSRYYLDDADVETHHRLFEEYQREAQRMIDARLPLPAHYDVLKCSHVFNILDSRGAIGTTQRAQAFARMRQLAHEVAALWVARREELGHPLGVSSAAPAPSPAAATGAPATSAQTLLLEVGTEELPAADVDAAVEQLRTAVPALLQRLRLEHGAVEVCGTPRRLVVIVDDVAPRQPDLEQTFRGPRVEAAFAADGTPTAAAAGFARSRGVDVSALERATVDGREHVVVRATTAGRDAASVLAGALGELVESLRFARSMRWCAAGAQFSRPVRWLVALLGDAVVPCVALGVAAGRTTRLLRNAEPAVLEVPHAAGHVETLAEHGILARSGDRRERIVERARALAGDAGGDVDTGADAATFDETANLVEAPRPLLASFDDEYLELPQEVLITVMRKHQRYLPVRDREGRLLSRCVVVANGDVDESLVRTGNEAVLRARYADAAFFWRHDLDTPAETRERGLERLVFTEKLGSMRDRARRIERLALALADELGCDESTVATLRHAGALVKNDYASQMVTEFTNLSGVMGRLYALHAGEPAEVAEALLEVELPRSAGDRTPRTLAGALLSIADRLDALTGLAAAGMAPRGSNDPMGQRRAALGVLQVLIDRDLPLDLRRGVELAAAVQPIAVSDAAITAVVEFLAGRFEQMLRDEGHRYDLVRAVLPLARRPPVAVARLRELEEISGTARFAAVAEAYRRAQRIVGADHPGAAPDPARFEDSAERRLWDAVVAARGGGEPETLDQAVAGLEPLVQPINDFFESVMVMADDEAVRRNRLALLETVLGLAGGIMDWSALQDAPAQRGG